MIIFISKGKINTMFKLRLVKQWVLHINNILVFVEAYRCDREIYGLFILKPQVVKVEICHNLISDGLASYRSLHLNKLRIIFAYRQTYCFRRLRSEVKFELLLHIDRIVKCYNVRWRSTTGEIIRTISCKCGIEKLFLLVYHACLVTRTVLFFKVTRD